MMVDIPNGFAPVTTDGMLNGDGDAYIYYAVGQTIVGSNNTPNTAGNMTKARDLANIISGGFTASDIPFRRK